MSLGWWWRPSQTLFRRSCDSLSDSGEHFRTFMSSKWNSVIFTFENEYLSFSCHSPGFCDLLCHLLTYFDSSYCKYYWQEGFRLFASIVKHAWIQRGDRVSGHPEKPQKYGVLYRAGTIRLSSDTICIAMHVMRYDTYHDISTMIQQHLKAVFL